MKTDSGIPKTVGRRDSGGGRASAKCCKAFFFVLPRKNGWIADSWQPDGCQIDVKIFNRLRRANTMSPSRHRSWMRKMICKCARSQGLLADRCVPLYVAHGWRDLSTTFSATSTPHDLPNNFTANRTGATSPCGIMTPNPPATRLSPVVGACLEFDPG